jgi:hypothetical protein
VDPGNGVLQTEEVSIDEIAAGDAITGVFESCSGENCATGTFAGVRVEPMDEPEAEGMTVVSEYGGPDTGEWVADGKITYNVRARGNLVYLARSDGLFIVDISDLDNPVERGSLPPEFLSEHEFYNDLKLIDGPDATPYALMGSDRRGVVVIDVSDADNPVEVATFPTPDQPDELPEVHTLFIEGTRAYLTYNPDQSLRIYDLSDPTNPVELGRWAHANATSGYLHDMYVKDGRAYLNYWNLGMVILDTQDPQNPVEVGTYIDYGGATSHSNWVTQVADQTISIHGDEEYGAQVRIVDVDPDSPDFLSTLSNYQTQDSVSVHNIMVYGDGPLVLVTYYQDGLRVLDVTDPANPVKVAHYHTWPGYVANSESYGLHYYEGAIGVDFDLDSGNIYIADTHRGVIVLRLDQ